jgi:NADPH2:quinone reductase
MKAIRFHVHGGPEVLKLEDLTDPVPGPGEAVVELEAIGVNFIDVYFRTGTYKMPLPATLGLEGAGLVRAVGAGVSEVAAGDRVAYTGVPGAYAQRAVVPAQRLVQLPSGLDARSGAAAMLQGMTAHYLTHSVYALGPRSTCLVHAAAGGVGLLVIQMAKLRGARVIGTVSTAAKAELARQAGADEIILYTEKDFEAETKRLTGGAGVQVVYDSVGKTTFMGSLNVLAPRGMLALFGQSSGVVPPFDPGLLAQRGSLFLTRPSLNHYVATREELLERAGDVLGWIASGKLRLRIEHTFPLADAARAHGELEARKTTGKLLLIP